MELCFFWELEIDKLALPINKRQIVVRVREKIKDCLCFGEENLLD